MLRSDPVTTRTFDVLGTLLLAQASSKPSGAQWFASELGYLEGLSQQQLREFLKQAEMQRVLRRTLGVLHNNLPRAPRGPMSDLLDQNISAECQRVEKALAYLRRIIDHFEERGLAIMVMKTLDHWPDTGSDLDLLVMADDDQVCAIFNDDLHAIKQPQSWGDRLAHKFNFRIPDLQELVEVHVGCLGQTGEQHALATGVLSRRMEQAYGDYRLPVPISEDRIVIATLQRMYRHYYIRLTDIVNIFGLLADGRVDFNKLKAIADVGSVWPGVATLVTIVCQHGLRYGGQDIELPEIVTQATRFNSQQTYLDRKFVRVPILPEAADLFLQQIVGISRKHNFRAMMRLSLLPVLATAAFVSFHVTGNDKGVW